MKFCCCHCHLVFHEKDALCEDWSDPNKSFICPGCGTHLIRETVDPVVVYERKSHKKKLRYLIFSLAIILLIPPIMYLANRGPVGLLLITLLITGVVVFLRKRPVKPEQTFRVEYH